MGNSAFIVIQIENNGSNCAGETLKGRILLDVRKAFLANDFLFRFYGNERTAVRINKGSEYSVTKTDKVIIFSQEVVLHRFLGGSVSPGRYEFPFEVAIPKGLPGSQSYSSHGDFFRISYHCEAKLHRPDQLAWTVKNSCEVLLNDEPYVSIPTPMFLGPITTKVTYVFLRMFLTSRGL
jgi:Arrestin (or S-antigen), N-terminal domain